MPLLRSKPDAELDDVVARAEVYRRKAGERRAVGEQALADRERLAGREATGELTPDASVNAYREATSTAEAAFEEAERLDAVAAELDQRAEQLRGEVADIEAQRLRHIAERANKAAVAQSRVVAVAARKLAIEAGKLEELREREDELVADADGAELEDEPAWLDRDELEQVTETLAAGPRTPNANREGRIMQLDCDRARADESEIRRALTLLRGNPHSGAVLQTVPERLHAEIRRRINEDVKAQAAAR